MINPNHGLIWSNSYKKVETSMMPLMTSFNKHKCVTSQWFTQMIDASVSHAKVAFQGSHFSVS